MTIDRKEVEALLHDIGLTADEHKCQPADVAFEVEGDTLAALCRTWLAVDASPEAVLSRSDVDAWSLPDTWTGHRVRIVIEPKEPQE